MKPPNIVTLIMFLFQMLIDNTSCFTGRFNSPDMQGVCSALCVGPTMTRVVGEKLYRRISQQKTPATENNQQLVVVLFSSRHVPSIVFQRVGTYASRPITY